MSAMDSEMDSDVHTDFMYKYLPIEVLAKGSYGQVILAVRLHPSHRPSDQLQQSGEHVYKVGKKVAVKLILPPQMKAGDIESQRRIDQEYQASMSHYLSEELYLKKLEHPHIVRLHESQREVGVSLPSYLQEANLEDPKSLDYILLESNLRMQEYLKDIMSIEYLTPAKLGDLYTNYERVSPSSYLVMDFAEKQNLYSIIAYKPLSERAALFLFNQMVDALSYMHKKKLLGHRDLKPENILITEDFDIQLADFGFCCEILTRGDANSSTRESIIVKQNSSAQSKLHYQCLGTLSYMAPEVLEP